MEDKGENAAKPVHKNENKLEKQAIILFVVMGLILASFLIAHYIFKPKPYFDYEGFRITKMKVSPSSPETFYVITLQGKGNTQGNIYLRNDPRKLNVSVDVDRLFGGISKVWITIPPDLKSDAIMASNDIGVFTSRISLNTSFALTKVEEGDYPQIGCENATKSIRVFLINISNETRVYEDGYCIIVEGTDYKKLVEAADSLVWTWLQRLKK